uniref:Uncharacterized protein n=1 Tax=Knipowitschia caucasica TaxID=637954 RepID=A0AAV2J1X7_KNICA
MNHGSSRVHPGESGELTNHEHQKHTLKRSQPFVVWLIKSEDNYPFGRMEIRSPVVSAGLSEWVAEAASFIMSAGTGEPSYSQTGQPSLLSGSPKGPTENTAQIQASEPSKPP